jgi:hypothetical protein
MGVCMILRLGRQRNDHEAEDDPTVHATVPPVFLNGNRRPSREY